MNLQAKFKLMIKTIFKTDNLVLGFIYLVISFAILSLNRQKYLLYGNKITPQSVAYFRILLN
jgi:hypothetical protein